MTRRSIIHSRWIRIKSTCFRDAVLEAFPEIKVQLKQPDITVRIDVRREHLMVSLKTIQGAGGPLLVQVVV